jgi:predicted TIM-barrel fold metal-dependent hydrolase
MYRRFDVNTFRAESAAWNVEKFINVAAARERYCVDETLELDRDAPSQGGPDAIVGGLPPAGTVADTIKSLDRQMEASRLRGVRPMGPDRENPVPEAEVLSALQERDLVFELMAHPHQLATAAKQLADFSDLTVVVEHTGWPRNDSEEERALWQSGLGALAALGGHVFCKLSGLVMPFGTTSIDVLSPWLNSAIELFGPDRCMFASNFPVDSAGGTFDELYSTFSAVTAELDDESRDQLFAGTAERVYRL